ncbi:BAHD acyltransferase DCR [Colletotrichum chlorophyti]|uniref:BAHD acyltransferase DCR n=1 Tax=Colletotrichum chlorophyti TaxID=708187 RepID=A0A1Q8S6I2_9PEZI|nr:BAHD acyltransferase DCR [Colletotrichum chlorophyti]
MGSLEFPPVVRLGPLDQIAPRIYVRSVFVFSLEPTASNSSSICNHLQHRFQAALLRWPFLAGQIRPAARHGKKNYLELAYDVDEILLNVAKRPDIFRYTTSATLGGYTYQELKQSGMPPSIMDKDILSLSPNHPQPGESCPPVTLKVTELRDGGLFACFSTHHAIFDGGFIKAFLEYVGNQMTPPSQPFLPFLMEANNRPSMSPYLNTNIENAIFPEYDFTAKTDLIPTMRSLTMNDFHASRLTNKPRAVCFLFQFKNSTLKNLHGRALGYVGIKYGKNAFVSKIDVLSGLVWVHTTRARLPHLSPADRTSFTTAADARTRLDPKYPSDAWGNIYTQTTAGTTVNDLLWLWNTPEETSSLDPFPCICEAAWLIRQAVEKVNRPEYIPQRIALAASLEDPTKEGTAFRKALQPDHAGLGCSVWAHMGADVDFGIPGTGGKAVYIRKTWSANDGSMNIMQRRGVTKGDAPWEVLLALREDDMQRICEREELGRWATSWCA